MERYFEFDDLGTAVGIGIRYILPVGPARIDMGVNPEASDGEDEVVFHIALGMAF